MKKHGPEGEEAPAHGANEIRKAPNNPTEYLLGMAEQLAELHRRSAHRPMVDRLREGNLQLSAAMSGGILELVVSHLIRLYGELDCEVRRLRTARKDERLLESFADDLVQILARCDAEIYTAKPGDPFDRARHPPARGWWIA